MGGFAGNQSLYPSIGLLHGVGESAAKGEDSERAQNLTLAAVQQRMNEAMQLMQQSTMQNIYSNGYDLQASQQAVYNPSQNYLYSTRTFSPAPTQANIAPPAPVKPKPLEIAAPAGKRAFMLDEES